ncbi:MAG: putative bacterioferritin comigratory protein [Paenibacillus sp.]|nr:putative bacterioferritin comigratory protein [Paenibacillus sp.]
MLKVGDQAPGFVGNSTKGMINTENYKGEKLMVLIFYPKDGSPICTDQLNAVETALPEYESVDAKVFAVNPADLDEHRAFAEKNQYSFPLITDYDGRIQEKYEVDKGLLKLFADQKRVVYIVDRDGSIVYAKTGNRPTEELLEAIRAQSQLSL